LRLRPRFPEVLLPDQMYGLDGQRAAPADRA
jgi:hypothetical protein